MAEQWLSIVEYARTYKVSDMTVRRRIKTGKLHAVLKEGKYFIPVPVGDVRSSTALESRAGADAGPDHSASSNGSTAKKSVHEMTVIKGHPAAHKTYQSISAGSLGIGSSANVQMHQGHQSNQTTSYPRLGETFGSREESGVHSRDFADFADANDSEQLLPSSLRRPLSGQETSLVDTRALLAFCEASLRKLNELERRQVERFKSKLEALENGIQVRDLEISQLRQQLEDLNLLVQMLGEEKAQRSPRR